MRRGGILVSASLRVSACARVCVCVCVCVCVYFRCMCMAHVSAHVHVYLDTSPSQSLKQRVHASRVSKGVQGVSQQCRAPI